MAPSSSAEASSSGPTCNNGILESGEACDTTNLGGMTCLALGFMSGTVSCNEDCTLNASACFQELYAQDFSGTHEWTLNVSTGTNGADYNFWVVNDNEGGVQPSGCSVGTNGNSTLHVTSVFSPSGGAAYDGGGLCGLLFCPQTNMRAESPVFSSVGFSSLSLSFDFIANGDALIDNASVWINTGAGWTVFEPSLKSTLCGGGQGQWTSYTATLPMAANNNPSVQIGFNWTNNDDGVSTDPSVAVDNVRVVASGI